MVKTLFIYDRKCIDRACSLLSVAWFHALLTVSTNFCQSLILYRLLISNGVQMVLGSISSGVNIRRIPFGLQLVSAGITIIGFLTVRVSPGLKDEFVRTVIYSSFLNRNHQDGLLRLVDMKKRWRILCTSDEKARILKVFWMRWQNWSGNHGYLRVATMGWSEFRKVSDFLNPRKFQYNSFGCFTVIMLLKYLHLWAVLPLDIVRSSLTTLI